MPVITVIFNNHSYDEPRNSMFSEGWRLAQEGKDMISYLGGPDVDFTHMARAYGIEGEKVRGPEQLDSAIQRAIRYLRCERDGRRPAVPSSVSQKLTWKTSFANRAFRMPSGACHSSYASFRSRIAAELNTL